MCVSTIIFLEVHVDDVAHVWPSIINMLPTHQYSFNDVFNEMFNVMAIWRNYEVYCGSQPPLVYCHASVATAAHTFTSIIYIGIACMMEFKRKACRIQ